jgi:two-component system sensor histidine kinase RegB
MTRTAEPTVPTAPAAGSGPAIEAGQGSGRVNLRTLITIRWIAVAGQFAAVLTVEYVLGFRLPLLLALATIGASVVLNLFALGHRASQPFLGDRDAALYLAYDTLQLALLLFLTGGLDNPFAALMLAPLTVGATVLSSRRVLVLTVLAVSCLTGVALYSFPLPWPEGQQLGMPTLYRLGHWAALSLSAMFIAGYVWQVARGARDMADALGASQIALARAQRVSALGALAAAAAHELGTPLGTIAVVAKEMAREVPTDSPLAEDIQLLQSQTARCRDILAELGRRPGTEAETDGGFGAVPITAVVEEAAAPYRRTAVALRIEPGGGAEPLIRVSPELAHGLGLLIQNAIQFARSQVLVTVDRPRGGLHIAIRDDGPGFPPGVLGRLGEPYLSARTAQQRDSTGSMGLGIFIAQTLLERTGATVAYANAPEGGAEVSLVWRSPGFVAEEMITNVA